VLGLDFNHQLEEREAQLQRGWTAEAGLVGGPDPTLLVRLRSASGPVTGLNVEVDMIMPGSGPGARRERAWRVLRFVDGAG